MWAIVTGASSGIGTAFAQQLSALGYDLVLVARRADRLQELANALPCTCKIMPLDLSTLAGCRALCHSTAQMDVALLINNAGFGLCGNFADLPLDRELEMISTNITAVHFLTKVFTARFVLRKGGHILNVASSAGFMAGPCMATYYATKNYVLRLSQALHEEMRRAGTGVQVCALCPGPVDTEFNAVAGVHFALHGVTAERVVADGLRGLFAGKAVVVPTLQMQMLTSLSKLCPEWLLPRITYHIQHGKISNDE